VQLGNTGGGFQASKERRERDNTPRLKKRSSRSPTPETRHPTASSEFVPGSYVKHAKYGRGLVLRREGAGDSLKLTVTFPGYGQKKLVQKYAGLEKA
jgi:DNA helicase-2/ATP-dependent DNA helicase PcrA